MLSKYQEEYYRYFLEGKEIYFSLIKRSKIITKSKKKANKSKKMKEGICPHIKEK